MKNFLISTILGLFVTTADAQMWNRVDRANNYVESLMDMSFSSKGGIKIPSGTTAEQRNTTDPWLRHNSDFNILEFNDGNQYRTINLNPDLDILSTIESFDSVLGLGYNSLISSKTFQLSHEEGTLQYARKVIPLPPKFRGKNLTLKFDFLSSAESFVATVRDATDTENLIELGSELVTKQEGTPDIRVVRFNSLPTTTHIQVAYDAIPEVGAGVSSFANAQIEVTKTDKEYQDFVVQEEDVYLEVINNDNQSIADSSAPIPYRDVLRINKGSWNGTTFTVNESGFYDISASIYYSNTTSSYPRIMVNDQVAETEYTSQSTGILSIRNINKKLFLNKNDKVNITLNSGATLSQHTIYHRLVIFKKGDTKVGKTSPDSKVEFGTSYIRLEGAHSRGTVATSVVKFDTLKTLKGDAFELLNTTEDGTVITMKKKGLVAISASVRQPQNMAVALTINQTDLTNVGADNGLLQYAYGNTTGGSSQPNATIEIPVDIGDKLRAVTDTTPIGFFLNNFTISFKETETAVRVSNIDPQFQEDDIYLYARNNASTAITVAVTDIPFSSVTDIKNLNNAWNGSVLTIPEDGDYTISALIRFGSAGERTLMTYVNGVGGKVIGYAPTGAFYVKGDATIPLNKGDSLSLRVAGTGGNLAPTNGHFFNVFKKGKPTVAGVDVTPFVNLPNMPVTQSQERVVATMSTTGAVVGSVGNSSGAGIFSYNSTTGLYTVLKKSKINMSISAGTVGTVLGFTINSTTIFGQKFNYGNYTVTSWEQLFNVGDTFSFTSGTSSPQNNLQMSVVATTTIESAAVADNSLVGEMIYSKNASTPHGFVNALNSSIGRTSGTYQGQKYFELYKVLWAGALTTTTTNPEYISSAKGASAEADWEANKTIHLNYGNLGPYLRPKRATDNIGQYYPDMFQGHTHTWSAYDRASAGNNSQPTHSGSGNIRGIGTAGYTGVASDGTNGTPRAGLETTPKYTPVYAYMRYSSDISIYMASPVLLRNERPTVETFWGYVNDALTERYYRRCVKTTSDITTTGTLIANFGANLNPINAISYAGTFWQISNANSINDSYYAYSTYDRSNGRIEVYLSNLKFGINTWICLDYTK